MKTILFSIGAVFAAGLTLTIIAPKTAHAMVATLVQVANTRATPVPNQDVDHPARNSFTATCSHTGPGDIGCVPSPMPNAANTKVVIQNVSMYVLGGDQTHGPLTTLFGYTSGGAFPNVWLPFFAQAPGGWAANQLVSLYADPGSTTFECFGIMTDPTTPHTLNCTVSGYIVALP